MDNIKDIVHDVIGQIASKQQDPHNKLERILDNILEKKDLPHVKLLGEKDGIVMILVDSPAWLFHLKLRKNRILKRLLLYKN